MRKILLSIMFLIMFAPLLYGTQVDVSGWSFTPETKTDTGINVTETDTVVWTPASGNRIVLMGVKFNSDTATNLLIESSSTAVVPATECTASGQVVIQGSTPLWQGTADATLTYTVGTKGTHSIMMWGYELE